MASRRYMPMQFDLTIYGVKQSPGSRHTRPQLCCVKNNDSVLLKNPLKQVFANHIAPQLGEMPAGLYNIRTKCLIEVNYCTRLSPGQVPGKRRKRGTEDIIYGLPDVDRDLFLAQILESHSGGQTKDLWQVVYFRPKATFWYRAKAPFRLIGTALYAYLKRNPVIYIEDLAEGYYLTTWRSRVKHALIKSLKGGEKFVQFLEGGPREEKKEEGKGKEKAKEEDEEDEDEEPVKKRATLLDLNKFDWDWLCPEQREWLKPSFPDGRSPILTPLDLNFGAEPNSGTSTPVEMYIGTRPSWRSMTSVEPNIGPEMRSGYEAGSESSSGSPSPVNSYVGPQCSRVQTPQANTGFEQESEAGPSSRPSVSYTDYTVPEFSIDMVPQLCDEILRRLEMREHTHIEMPMVPEDSAVSFNWAQGGKRAGGKEDEA
ncbi:hypothetical protein TWF481_011278 [Arthrobotrys musiformis]|uniref:Uncharacterized protein n=1 Tax=Arthrobotrys musiformis TaxID=47236 RepID=A0AAV9VZP5_9PEZI